MTTTPTPLPGRRATINDVARAAAVSRQTVSNVLNSPAKVAPQTRARVEAAITDLGYRPDAAARSMRARRAGAVGIELNVNDAHSDVAHPLLSALVLRAPQHGAHLVPFSHPTRFPAVEGYQDMVRRRLVDGFVLTDTHLGDPRPTWLQEEGIPFAAFGRLYGHPELTSWADVDGEVGTRLATEHLLEAGYGTIAYLGWPRPEDPSSELARTRRAGWLAALTGRGLAPGPQAECDQDLGAALDAARTLLSGLRPGDAVVCASDLLALGVMFAAVEHGLQVGRDLGVVGFDGSTLAQRYHLTTVTQPLEHLADALLGMVHHKLTGGSPAQEGLLLSPTLTPRTSSRREDHPDQHVPLPGPHPRRPDHTEKDRS